VRLAVARRLIDTIRHGSIVFAYYPDPEWLNRSHLLHGCGGTDAGILSAVPVGREAIAAANRTAVAAPH